LSTGGRIGCGLTSSTNEGAEHKNDPAAVIDT
jgi:hypothetical protein